MDFAYSEEQESFRELLRRFVREEAPLGESRRIAMTADGFDRTMWKRFAEELGLVGLLIPEAYGGQGFGFLEQGIVFEELGRALVCSPLLAHSMAIAAILSAGTDEQKARLLPDMASGDRIGTLALLEANGSWDPTQIAAEATAEGDAVRVSAEKRFVLDGQNANRFVVAARTPGTTGADGIQLVVVEADAEGVEVEPFEPLDLTRKQAHVRFTNAPGERLGAHDTAIAALRKTLDQAAVSLAAEAAGAAEACLDAAVEYAKSRIQFARPIGSFQAIKHKCSEVLLEVESARTTSRWAAWVVEQDADDLTEAACLAKATCTDALLRAAQENVQIHGGIGFTFEADPHLFYRRARSTEVLLGDPTYHRTRMLRARGI